MAQKTARKTAPQTARNKARNKDIARTKGGKAAAKSGLVAGAKAPTFSLPCAGGGTVALADFTGRTLVLYFYPRADTSGCTREAIDFSRLKSEFGRAGADIVGVSADSVKALDAFKAKHNLTVALACDESHKMLEAYGAWQEKSMYGRKFLGIVRSTFLIGPDQRIAQVWPKVTVDGHAAAVLAAVKAL
jgi:thioredoxin-dependent peroxiredoxin